MVQVKVNEGLLEGERVTSDLVGTFYSFKGIPYAAPPIGDLRFKAPQPVKPWSGVLSAKQHGPQCPQYNIISKQLENGSEDCLYLNVYTPNLEPNKPLPVMIWIHGGYFCSGNGNDDVFGPEFLIRHDVILVTLNYRLEVLGFLCLENEDIPGNAGIKDQVAAMKWVKNNISSFGGDPNNITIFVSEKVLPNVETFFTGDITDALKNNVHEGVELIVGFNEDDGAITFALIHDIENTISWANNSEGYFVPTTLGQKYSKDELKEIGSEMKKMYTRGEIVSKNNLSPVANYYGADFYKYEILQFAKQFSVKNKVYFYIFSCFSERNVFAKLFGISSYFTKNVVSHNDDIAYLFPISNINQKIPKTSVSYNLIYRMTSLWTNFAKTGNPTPDTKLGCNWRTFNAKTKSYLNIGNELTRGVAPLREEMEFWEKMYEKSDKLFTTKSS
uniref:Carboxylesterase n=1 Tax=Chilo suppressalis TaxID=168631 RepID=A0A0B4RY24_CHISP|nr:carboxylesterase [Chilo suppressalis]